MSVPRPILRLAAVLFAGATVLYSALWMYYIRWQPPVSVGIEFETSLPSGPLRITRVIEDRPAARAGIRPGDRVRAIDGRAPAGLDPLGEMLSRSRPGDIVRFTIDRPGADASVVFVTLGPPIRTRLPLAQAIASEIIGCFPLPFLVVGLVVLFARLEDRNAWLLALLFAGLITGGPLLQREGAILAPLRGFAVAYKVVFYAIVAAVFYHFFAVFPAASWLERRFPWLKNALLAAAAVVAVPLGLAALWAGGSRPVFEFADRLGSNAISTALRIYYFGAFGLGLVSAVSNRLYPASAEARRKTGVILWGTVAALTPFLLLMAASSISGRGPYEFPFWVWAPCVLAVSLLPVSFAYAVVKHRVLEIPVLLRRSARYVLVKRGFAVLVVLIAVVDTAVFSLAFTRFVRVDATVAIAVGVGFGLLLARLLAPALRRSTERIDRAFFRSAYDARRILESLAQKIRTVTSREALATLLRTEVAEALHPASIAIWFAGPDGRLRAAADGDAAAPEPLSPEHPLLRELARAGEPLDVSSPERHPDRVVPAALAGAHPECLVPVLGRDGRLAGLAALGPRLSEEPYSRDDRQLLVSVANQAGIALDSLRMAEEIAERMEAERRVALELEVARDVQRRLLPQGVPRIETLDCAAACLPARVVGGDYYDFLDLGGGEVGLVLADIAGKGMAAALLMANLQASLRSQAGLARDDLPRLLRGVNRALLESSDAGRFATLFLGCYAPDARRLRYANCGHDPPILLRSDGRVERLAATATVLGAFETWDSATADVCLAPGDTLLLYSDGIREAMNEARDEFGEAGLLDTLRRHRALDVPALLAAILHRVQEFSRGKPEDDVTLLVARCR